MPWAVTAALKFVPTRPRGAKHARTKIVQPFAKRARPSSLVCSLGLGPFEHKRCPLTKHLAFQQPKTRLGVRIDH